MRTAAPVSGRGHAHVVHLDAGELPKNNDADLLTPVPADSSASPEGGPNSAQGNRAKEVRDNGMAC